MRLLAVLLTGVFVFLQYHLWFDEGGILSMWKMKHRVQAEHVKVIKARQKNNMLVTNIQDLKKGSQLVESHARSDLGMVKKGEVFYRVVK